MGLVKPLPAQIAKIKVVGIGGGGGNVINFMATKSQIRGVDLVAVNTDAQALLVSQAKIKVQIGEKLTRGLGAGGDPEMGEQAAEESREKIKEILEGTDMVFVAGGLGGGTCSGASPVIAQIAKEEVGALTVAVVTKPFLFEGTKRMVVAEDAVEKLKEKVDSIVIIPNQRLLEVADENTPFLEAFRLADSVLAQAVAGIADLITTPGFINLDFADIRSVMKDSGTALMGVGTGSGENRTEEAIKAAMASPLLDVSIEGARGVLFNITGGPDLTMKEVEESAQLIAQKVGGDANIIFGATIQEKLKDQVKITLVATGFDLQQKRLAGLIKETKPSLGVKEKTVPLPNSKKKNVVKIDLTDSEGKMTPLPQELPEGVEIESELDIPSFLRRGSS